MEAWSLGYAVKNSLNASNRRRLGGPHSGKEKNYLLLLGIEPRVLFRSGPIAIPTAEIKIIKVT
jgi:hypothetical protein